MSEGAEPERREPTPAEIEQARREWAERTGRPYAETPPEVVYLDTSPLTAAEAAWARAVLAELEEEE